MVGPCQGIWANLSTVPIKQGRQQPVDLLVDHHHRQALAGPPASGEWTGASHVATEQQRAPAVQVHTDVAGLVDRRPAPRAGRELGGRAAAGTEPGGATLLLDPGIGLLGPVGGRLPPNPEPDPERRRTEPPVAPLQRLLAKHLAGAQQRGRPLELLQGEQPQRVPHQHGNALAAVQPRDGALEASQRHRVDGKAQVGLGLAATGREPQQVDQPVDAAPRVGRVAHTWQVEQEERQLERPPAPVTDLVDLLQRRLEIQVGLTPAALGGQGVDPLPPHRVVGEPERLGGQRVSGEQLDAAPDTLGGRGALIQGATGGGLEPVKLRRRVADPRLLPADPGHVGVDQRQQPAGELLVRRGRQDGHVEGHTGQLGHIGDGRRVSARYLVGRDGGGADEAGSARVLVVRVDVDPDTVADGELDLPPVGHGERFGLAVLLRGTRQRRTAPEDPAAVARVER
jgi:hypothetical protein